jgi:carbonic anhydrase/acetyltransferase-like protein (isoleucine patch superfamily)
MCIIVNLGHYAPQMPAIGTYWLAANATLVGRVTLGPMSSVWYGAVVRADDDEVIVGSRSNIQDNAVIHVDSGYPVRLGDDCTVGHSARLHGCTIGNGTVVGMGATILNGAVIGSGCMIGAHTLVPERMSVPDCSLIVGTPARIIKTLDADAVTALRDNAESYVRRWQSYPMQGQSQRIGSAS